MQTEGLRSIRLNRKAVTKEVTVNRQNLEDSMLSNWPIALALTVVKTLADVARYPLFRGGDSMCQGL
jgi:hypothetical protein